jgi:hypothetical protein
LILVGCFKNGNVDGEVFMRALVAVFERYSQQIVDAVTNPVDGLPASLQWIPTIAEVKAACDARAERYRKAVEIENRRAAQIAERNAPVSESARERALAYARETVEKLTGTSKPELSAIQVALRSTEGARNIDPVAAEMLRASVAAPLTVSAELAAKVSSGVPQ